MIGDQRKNRGKIQAAASKDRTSKLRYWQAAFLLTALLPLLADMPATAQCMAIVTLVMAWLWIAQIIPIAATSLIPLVAFLLRGIQPAKDVSKAYIDQNVFLFLGGFIIALGIEKWGLHRRIGLHIVWLTDGAFTARPLQSPIRPDSVGPR